MARMPGAVWKPLPRGFTTRMTGHDIICEHTMVGSLAGTDGYFRSITTGVNSHYGTGGLGEIWQWGDTAYRSGANLNGNPNVISVENADMGPGFAPWNTKDGAAVPAFTAAQIEANARILAWESSRAAHAACPPTWTCHKVGIPLELIPDAKPGRRGIGYHRQGVPGYMAAGAVKWSNATGKVCPGNRRIAQIPLIIARARQLAGGATALLEDDDMQIDDLLNFRVDGRNLYDFLRDVHLWSGNVHGKVVDSKFGMDGRPGPDADDLLGQVLSIRAEVQTLAQDVAELQASPAGVAPAGQPVDYDRIITGVADKLAARLKE